MKKTILPIALFTIAAILQSCNSSDMNNESGLKEVQSADNQMVKHKQEQLVTKEDSIFQFRKESYEKLSVHEKNVRALKAVLASQKENLKTVYEEKMADIEQQNLILKQRLETFGENGTEAWENFKVEFNNDMEKLGEAVSDLTAMSSNKLSSRRP
ncbi:MAG: hypothetical protein KKA07_10520 [Bacteroidetes bacterium]|nr:hypothetical protein [Bacteroidota bacterium]